ncbi:MAG TPA: TonB-dependent receptor [Longimicrobium sp.]|jgi:outer membrane receptor protein involved in Fe transport
MKPFSGLTLALLLTCGTTAAFAQTPTPQQQQRPMGQPGAPGGGARPMIPQEGGAQLRGTILDAATGRPVPSATVGVWSRADSTLAAGAVTRPDGTFRVEGLRPGRYFLRVSHIGHTTSKSSEIAIAPGATTAEAPSVRLAASAVQLEGITATGQRSAVQMSADRNTYSTKDMPTAAGGNSTDVLRNVPAVEVDQDGRVSLRGNQNVAIQINGRAAPMRGDQLGQFLQQLPANMIERVEVVPNPSAKYDPEGMAGIVNIVLKGNAELGLSGGLTLAAGTNDRYNGSGNLGYQRGRVTLFGSYGYFGDGRTTSGFNNRTNITGAGSPINFLDQLSNGAGRMQSHTLNTNTEVKLGKTNSLAATLMVSGRDFRNDTRNTFTRYDAQRNALAASDDRQHMTSDDGSFDGTLSYRNVIKPRQNELTVEARYNRSAFDQSNGFTQQPMDVNGAPIGNQPFKTQNLTDAANSEMYLMADLTRMLGGVRVETGYKGQLRQVDNDLTTQRFSYADNAWVNSGGSNVFAIDERVHAGYGVFTRQTGKFELQGGLRLERTDRSTNRSDDDLEPFNDFFPSALVAYNVDAARQVKASYSRRIQRPQTQMLNSFLFYEDPLNRFRGNPYLRPEYTDAFELGFQQSGKLGSLQLTPFFRHTEGAIRRVRTTQGDTITSTVSNIATADSYGADANASLRAGRLTGFIGGNVFHQDSDGGTAAGAISSSGLGWSTRANANLRINKSLDASGFLMYRGAMNTEYGRIGAFAMTNFSLRHKLLKDKANVTLRVQDPFNMMRMRSTAEILDASLNDPNGIEGYRVETERRFGARGVFVAFNYTFGQTPRLRAPRQQEPQSDPGQPMGTP